MKGVDGASRATFSGHIKSRRAAQPRTNDEHGTKWWGTSLYGEREHLADGLCTLDSLAGCNYLTKLATSNTLQTHARQLILASHCDDGRTLRIS